ncbi:alpha/beta hydrolase [Microbacterium sp. 2FI]|uniref:alpha/beta hydrolase n=1 Tax=Microbacterium sp. 2FI TaxID=2502193 RepID=UPI0010FA44BE|nr:alpha/beta hydrolase [Microbacterium sp. 2FI]
MSLQEVDPALHRALRFTPDLNLESRLSLWLIARASRLAPGARVEGVDRRVVKRDGVSVRVYIPEQTTGAALLWIHGGGLVLGAAKMDDRFCGESARDLGVVVVSVDYRVAPQHPFPAAHDDAYAAWQWLERNAADLGVDRGRIAVGGQSAGGGLAAALVQRLHDEGTDAAAQVLLCPMLDDRTAADRSLDARAHLIWNNRSNLVGWTSYLGGPPGDEHVPPYAVPARREDLAGLPPTWIYASDLELFHDEDVDYARRLEAAGVDTTLEVVAGAVHGFEAWAPDTHLARDLTGRARAWLGEQLAR